MVIKILVSIGLILLMGLIKRYRTNKLNAYKNKDFNKKLFISGVLPSQKK